MNIEDLIDEFQNTSSISQNIVSVNFFSKKIGKFSSIPDVLNNQVLRVLESLGIKELYSHQVKAIYHVTQGKNIVVVTPTASGKTLCYNIPVIDSILEGRNSTALYIFPTKALSQDQVKNLISMIKLSKSKAQTFIYDGDTAGSMRRKIRETGRVIITNPDMLHLGILPHHTKWYNFLSGLKYIVIDEIHVYKGIFGSHFANVLRRLKRICKYYGSAPQFICTSATINNPDILASKLTDEEVHLISENGAPTGDRYFLLYNPPLIPNLNGIRRNMIYELKKMMSIIFKYELQTIIFAGSRLMVELILKHLRPILKDMGMDVEKIAGYRGGYLPNERRKIENDLKNKKILCVVSTNALELGIDIGELEVSVICGYPGSISSLMQQAGRAGRKANSSLAVFIARNSPLDQFLIKNSDYLFSKPPENAIINPFNLAILANHLKCSIFELPFKQGELYGKTDVSQIIGFLDENKIIHKSGDKFHWAHNAYPAEGISLRSVNPDNITIVDKEDGEIIGIMDLESAPFLIHPGAIYLHLGRQYEINELDMQGSKAVASKVKVNYFTTAKSISEIEELSVDRNRHINDAVLAFGELLVRYRVVSFKRVKMNNFENLGVTDLDMPERTLQTCGTIIRFPSSYITDFTDVGFKVKPAMHGLVNVFINIAPVFLLCDRGDIRADVKMVTVNFSSPVVYIYDGYPGGIGYAEKFFEIFENLMLSSLKHIESCECKRGCPSCVGVTDDMLTFNKESTIFLIKKLLHK